MTSIVESNLAKVAGVLAGIVGIIVGRYAGFALVIPTGIAVAVYAVGSRQVSGARRLVMPAVAVVGGHLGWMILGVITAGQLGAVWLDLPVFGLVLLWLLRRPGPAPLWTLTALQAVAFVTNVVTMAGVEFGTSDHRALLVHIVFRILSIVLNGMALHELKGLHVNTESSLPPSVQVSLLRRLFVIGCYLSLLTFGALVAFAVLISEACLLTDTCSDFDFMVLGGIAMGWIAGATSAAVLGWRGYLFGARAIPPNISDRFVLHSVDLETGRHQERFDR